MSAKSMDTAFAQRHARLAILLQNAGLNALALNPSSTLTYLTGLRFHLSERPVVFLFMPHTPPAAVLPELEAAKLSGLSFAVQAFPYGENPAEWPAAFRQAFEMTGVKDGQVGVDPGAMRVLELRLLEQAAPKVAFVSAESSLAELRMRKDEDELAAMRKAVEIAQQALQAALPCIKPGASERQVAAELVAQLLRAGSETPLPFEPIVSSGPNGANPHASPSDRLLAAGDLLVIDWGANHLGYFSDLTRTFAIGQVEPELETIARLVKEANAAGRQAARPGATAAEVDQAARQVIEQGGYGAYFIHRTGHGLGMESHEPPYIFGGNSQVLHPGMTFTIEPGIYLPGRAGVRIEDDVAITEQGLETLSDLPRELVRLGA